MLTNLVKVAITIAVEMSLTLGEDGVCRFFRVVQTWVVQGMEGVLMTYQLLNPYG